MRFFCLSGTTVAASSTVSYGSLKLGNVCVALARAQSYDVTPTVDFYIIGVRTVKGELVEKIYVGYNPDVGDENRNMLSRKLYNLPLSKRIVRLSGQQSNQILGIPAKEAGFYFHIMPVGQVVPNRSGSAPESYGVMFC